MTKSSPAAHILTITLLATILANCDNSGPENTIFLTNSDTLTAFPSDTGNPVMDIEQKVATVETEIIIKNKTDYSEKFINDLRDLGYKKFELIDSFLVIDNLDTVQFSKTPQIGEKRIYTGKKDHLAIAVTVTRINYTTVDYTIEMVEFGKTNHNQNGQADISSSFFLGAESNEDEQTGDSYFVTEYSDDRENDCFTHIRLGDENDLAKIIKNCNGTIRDITLDNFTTLHRK